MKLTFLGTRGNIKIRSTAHHAHASLLVEHNRKKIMIDCGTDHKKTIDEISPDALLITHAHPDHVGGLKKENTIPVFATLETWQVMKHYPLYDRRIIVPEQTMNIAGLLITAFKVEHALNAPAVGYKISDGKKTIFYASDLVKIVHQSRALKEVDLYIGDGAIIKRTLLIRKRNNVSIGHAPIMQQIAWCKKERVPQMIITHCGTEITSQDKNNIMHKSFKEVGQSYNVDVILAFDGMKFEF